MGGKEKCKVKRELVGRERMQGDETSMSSSLLLVIRRERDWLPRNRKRGFAFGRDVMEVINPTFQIDKVDPYRSNKASHNQKQLRILRNAVLMSVLPNSTKCSLHHPTWLQCLRTQCFISTSLQCLNSSLHQSISTACTPDSIAGINDSPLISLAYYWLFLKELGWRALEASV